MPKLLSANECDAVAGRYDQDQGFRSHIVMARNGFGRGEYKYFAYPLPPLVEVLSLPSLARASARHSQAHLVEARHCRGGEYVIGR